MVVVDCPFPGCEFQTNDVADGLASTLLQIHASGCHSNTAVGEPSNISTTSTAARVEKVRRPTISTGGTSEEWSYFKIRWNDYVAATKISGKDLVIQLLECCDEDLRKDLTRAAGGTLTDKLEADVLQAIKTLAVREENTMVARVTLHEMRQDRDEPIRSFGARVRGQAGVCKYLINCACGREISYSDYILRDVVVRGLVDSEIQLDLLSDSNQNMTLEEILQFVEKKEAGKRSANRLLESQGVESISSQYRKNQRLNIKELAINKSDPCSFCGRRGHGKNSNSQIRKANCPAYGTACNFCKKLHHLEHVCRLKYKNKELKGSKPNQEVAVFDSLCAVTTSHLTTDIAAPLTLDHHLYDHLNSQWQKIPSQPQPYITLQISIAHSDYPRLGYKTPNPAPTVEIFAMADTGCQSCLMGVKLLKKLQLTPENLIPVTMRMHTANNNQLQILGAVILDITGQSQAAVPYTTKQIVYVTNESDKFYLSRQACADLGMISNTFPTVGETTLLPTTTRSTIPDVNELGDNLVTQISQATSHPKIHVPPQVDCSCIKRELPPARPSSLPFPATEGNRQKLEDWLKKYYASSTFNTCSHQSLPMMDTPPLRLMVDREATPVAHHTPVPVPVHWQEEVKAGIERDIRLGVIEPVPIGEPVTWCHRMVICAKKDGSPRRTVDFQALNANASRETHHTSSPFHQARSVPSNKKKTVFDCWNGYHSIPLHEEDRHLTTFITPWGRLRYKVAPQGYIASGDGYTRRFDEIVSDVPNMTKCVDDSLLWSDTLENSFFQAVEWLDLCGRNGITLHPGKFQFGRDTVTFAGFEITNDCVKPCKKFLDAIAGFPTPKNIHDIRSWFGLINQVSYAFASSEKLQPFRHLLQPNTPFIWNNHLNELFEESKSIILHEIENGISIFDKTKPTCLATDWSKNGLGYWLIQQHCSCNTTTPFCCPTGWKTTLVGSRFTSKAESRYAPIEGEALAVVDALEKARYFVLGCKNLIICVDHKPLLKIFSDRSLNDIPNPRLRKFKEKTLRYRFKMMHIPGVKHKIPDTLSRYPVSHDISLSNEENSDTEAAISTSVLTAIHNLQAVTWDKVKIATQSDESMLQLLHTIENGFPISKHDLPNIIQEYYQYRDDLYSIDGVILYKNRIVIPSSLREDVLNILHSAHQGISPMLSRAMDTVFWPGITAAIHDRRNRCADCHRNTPSQPHAPPYPVQVPEYPFQCICADFFQYEGLHYLVAVDRYSNWPIIEKAHEGSKGLINCLRKLFATFGIPDEIASDRGPEFTAATTSNFLKNWGVNHRLSSVAFPHSNCRAEIGVKTAKRILISNTGPNGNLDTDALQRAMLQYRNTPDPQTGLSPAMCLFGRPIKDFIPILPGRYEPHPTWVDTLNRREEALRNRHIRAAERWTQHTKQLPPLCVHDHVRVQNQTGPHPLKWDKTGRIVEVRQFDQYVIRIDGSGRTTIRNRKFLRKFVPVQKSQAKRSIAEDIRFLPTISRNKTPNLQPTISVEHKRPPTPNTPTSQKLLHSPAATNIAPTAPPPEAEVDISLHHQRLPSPPEEGSTKTKRPPLALRRLMDYNSKGLNE